MISDIGDLSTEEQMLYELLISKCRKMVQEEHIPIGEAVSKCVDLSRNNPLGTVTDTSRLEKVLFQEVTQEHTPTPVIKSEDARVRRWWTDFKTDRRSPLEYWNRYKRYLLNKPGWSVASVSDLDKSTDEVMNALADPRIRKSDERRGLVYGDVQSGKTAHYIGLINKAFCAGYKIIIVLSGMQNSLRSQTQSRIDEEVLGYETSQKMWEERAIVQNSIGVGTIMPTAEMPHPLQSLTNRDENGDFNTNNSLGSYQPPFIIVTKKVKSPLSHVINSIENSTITRVNPETGIKYVPAETPALIIDDEADQASINTKRDAADPETNPTTINGLIRKLLNLFQCRSYVGYTATPFANIFIPHRVVNDVYGKDLFPKDFIAKSPRPNLYIGAREFFGLGDRDNVPSMPLIRIIKEGVNFLPQGTRSYEPVGELPEELKTAVKYFFISTAVRNLRGQRNKPNTMLVHIVRFVDQQNAIKGKINDVLNELTNYIKYSDNDTKEEFRKIYDEDYIPTSRQLRAQFERYMDGCIDIPFDLVWEEVFRIALQNEIIVRAVNGKSNDSLLYKNYEHSGQPFNVIAVGGDKLSRGLTLEGLTISYFTRSAGAMDTLMQMGRWFGYRPGYIDLCRLFTTQGLSDNFETISYSTANLSAQFDDMNIEKSDPEHFGLRVAEDPNILISARNKIRTGAEYRSDFSCSLTQTRIMDTDDDVVEANYAAVDSLLSSIDQNRLDVDGHETYESVTGRHRPNGKTFWTGVSGSVIADFFENYITTKTAIKASSRHIADYIRELNRCGGVIDWTVCLAGTDGSPTSKIATRSEYGPIMVHGITRNKQDAEENGSDHALTRDLHVLISGKDEYLDLNESEYKESDEYRELLKGQGKRGLALSKEVRRKVRKFKHGFLILYPIERAADDLKTKNGKAPYAFAVVFPDRGGRGNLKQYRLNEVAVELDDEQNFRDIP